MDYGIAKVLKFPVFGSGVALVLNDLINLSGIMHSKC